MRSILLFIFIFFLTSCTHSVHLVNYSEDIPASARKNASPIKAKTEQFVVMNFTDNTDYVNQAYNSILRQCPNGKIGGISTKYYTSHGFFSWTNYIEMNAFCYN